jgi:NAD+ kinase
MGAVNTVGLVLHPRRDPTTAIQAIIGWASARSVSVLGLPDEIARIDCTAIPVEPNALAERSDILVSLGGDGTMLRAMRLIMGRPAPVLGVNLGKLGFLAEIDVAELPRALSAFDGHEFTVEPRTAVAARLGDADVHAFNDIALVRIPGDGLVAVSVSVDGHPFVRYAADAVIVATATGSTAYSFSAGGPIISPTVEGFLVVPAAAHSTFNRAIVLAADEVVTLDLLPSSGIVAVEVDGRINGQLGPGDQLRVTARRAAARVVRLGNTSFYQRARRKLQVTGSAEVS